MALASEAGAKSRAKASGERLSRLDIEYYSIIGVKGDSAQLKLIKKV